MKRVGLYARVSPGRQEQEMTIESQVAAIEAHVSAMGAALDPEHRYIDNGWTSDSLLRPGLEALRDAVALGSLDCIVLYDPDRLSRRFVDQQVVLEEIERKHVEVIFVMGGTARTDEERLALQMRGVFAEFERAKIRERTRRGRLYRARAGAPPGWPNPPYGLRLLRGQKPQPATVVVEACEAAVVHQMFEWVGFERLRLRQLSQRLEQRGIQPRSGKRWATSTLLSILRNPLYTGQAHHQKYERIEPKQPRTRGRFRRRRKTSSRKRPEQEWIGVRVPAIVDQALFDRVQQVLVDNRRQTAGQVTHPYLLRGLLFCSACGRSMWGRCVRFGTPRERRYYGCNAQGQRTPRGDHRCPSRPVRADDVEQVVWEDLARWLQEPEQLAAQLEAQRDTIRTVLDAHAAEQRRLAREMKALTQGIERLVDAYQAGAISIEELRARRERFEENKQKCQARIAHAERQYQQAHAQQQVVDELRQLKERLHRGLERCTWEDRRAIVELLVEKVEVAAPKLVVHYIVPLGRAGTPPMLPPSTEPNSGNPTQLSGETEPNSEKAAQPSGGLCRPCPRHQHDVDMLRAHSERVDDPAVAPAGILDRLGHELALPRIKANGRVDEQALHGALQKGLRRQCDGPSLAGPALERAAVVPVEPGAVGPEREQERDRAGLHTDLSTRARRKLRAGVTIAAGHGRPAPPRSSRFTSGRAPIATRPRPGMRVSQGALPRRPHPPDPLLPGPARRTQEPDCRRCRAREKGEPEGDLHHVPMSEGTPFSLMRHPHPRLAT